MMHPAVHGFGRDANAVKGKRLERDLLRRVLHLARPYRAQLIGFVISVVLAAVIGAVPPLILRALIDTAIPDKNRELVGAAGVRRRLPGAPQRRPRAGAALLLGAHR